MANTQSPLPAMRLIKKFKAHSQKEGAGFVVRRPIGGPHLLDSVADPFLLLDELGPVEYAKGEFPGAPWHPHRGFDTVMYLKEGEGAHRDSMGNSGVLRAGDCQWMTAASGIVHDEGRDHPGGTLHGFQCWVNLPAKHKMDPPKYQDVPSNVIPTFQPSPGVSAKVIAGTCAGVDAVVQTLVPIQYIDFVLEPRSPFEHGGESLAAELETVIVYVYSGSGAVGGTEASSGDTIVLGRNEGGGDGVILESGAEGMSALFLAGKPLREPISRHGPFVMNTREEIMQAFMDYQNGTLVRHKGTMVDFEGKDEL